jgi:general secretion pathway protein L
MSVLRLYCPLQEYPSQCEWVLLDDSGKPAVGKSPLVGLPKRTDRVQLIIPAPEVLIIQARLPAAARRAGGDVLAFAVEERTVSEQDANNVSWLGSVGENGVLAVLDKRGLERWRSALDGAGLRGFEVHSEMLLLPCAQDEWSIAWNGHEGFVRTGNLEAAATDSGDRESPPLSLRLMLDRQEVQGGRPRSLALYTTAEDALPDLEAWQASLGIAIRDAGVWDWRAAPVEAGSGLTQESPRWRGIPAFASKLRMAAWIAALSLVVHAAALAIDWTLLASEQRSLRREMDARFRATFPDAVAVVDPVLQMRRKLAEARHAAGQPDAGDFLPMVEKVATETKNLPAGAVRILSYEGGRIALELTAVDDQAVNRIVSRLRQLAMAADPSSSGGGNGRVVISVRVP